MDEFREIVDLKQFEQGLRALAAVLPALGLLGGLIGGAWRKRALHSALVKGLAIGALGPILYALWRLYGYLVRYDPQTGYVGLHRVSVLLLNVAIFAAVGVLLGLAYSYLFRWKSDGDASVELTRHGE